MYLGKTPANNTQGAAIEANFACQTVNSRTCREADKGGVRRRTVKSPRYSTSHTIRDRRSGANRKQQRLHSCDTRQGSTKKRQILHHQIYREQSCQQDKAFGSMPCDKTIRSGAKLHTGRMPSTLSPTRLQYCTPYTEPRESREAVTQI